jgi:hypothetical protein
MKTQMTPSNGMSSLITDAMTASQRLRPKLTPSAEHYASVTSCRLKRIVQEGS